MEPILARKLARGDTIGMVSPCYAITEDAVAKARATLEGMGFRVKTGRHIFSTAYGYAASLEERVSDFNDMITDQEVRMILFGGGEVGNELLPYLDYAALSRSPKLVCSYSDGTTLLNAVYARTGLVTYYGLSPRTFFALTDYNRVSFTDCLMAGKTAFRHAEAVSCVHPGIAEGILLGGYLPNFSLMLGSPYVSLDPAQDYLLFWEDHERFSDPAVVAKHLAHLDQHGVFRRVRGMIVGHYAAQPHPELDALLARTAQRYDIPLLKTEDFGHGPHNAVIPIGIRARLDAAAGTLSFLTSPVAL